MREFDLQGGGGRQVASRFNLRRFFWPNLKVHTWYIFHVAHKGPSTQPKVTHVRHPRKRRDGRDE